MTVQISNYIAVAGMGGEGHDMSTISNNIYGPYFAISIKLIFSDNRARISLGPRKNQGKCDCYKGV